MPDMTPSPIAGGVERLFDEWCEQVYNRAEEIDPDNERKWSDLNLGWCLAKGLSLVTARAFYQYCIANDAF